MPENPSPFRLDVYDKTFDWKGTIGNPLFVSAQIRHNVKSLTTISMPADHPRAGDIVAEGARVVITNADGHVSSGNVHSVGGEGPAKKAKLTFTVHDDFRILHDVLGWVEPTLPIANQGDNKAYDRRGPLPAETLLKQYVTANAINRLGLPLTCAPDQGRGANISAALRFHPLYDRIFPSVDGGAGLETAGIGVTIKQVGAGLVLDVYSTGTVAKVLTEKSGVIDSWRWSREAPTATRAVLAGQGQAELRVFRNYVDTAREAAWGPAYRIERVGDARDEPDPAVLVTRGQKILADGDRKTGLSVELAETASFRYGKIVKVGDLVRLDLLSGQQIGPLVLEEALLSWTRDEGYKVTPKIGDLEVSGIGVLSQATASVVRYLRHKYLSEG